MNNKGFVSLVGAGPGDAELMTVKAVRLLTEADVVVYDRLVSADILSLIPSGVSRISVGKEVIENVRVEDAVFADMKLHFSDREVVKNYFHS